MRTFAMLRSLPARLALCILVSAVMTACKEDPVAPVYVPVVHGVRVSPSQVTIRLDETAVLVADVDADSGANKDVIWSSADPRRVGVTATGIILGISPGV